MNSSEMNKIIFVHVVRLLQGYKSLVFDLSNIL